MYATVVFFGEFVDDRRHAHARAAPCGPEVDYYGFAGGMMDFTSESVNLIAMIVYRLYG